MLPPHNSNVCSCVVLAAYTTVYFFLNEQLFGKAETRFDKERTMIWLNPYVKSGHLDNVGSFDVPSIMKMVTVIASKFDNIVMNDITPQRIYQAESLIPEAVATYNKLYRNKTTGLKPLKLYMHFTFSHASPASGADNGVITEHVKDLANNANEIYPNTVVAQILSYSNQDCQVLENDVNLIISSLSAPSSSSSSSSLYKLGITASMEYTVDAYKVQKCIQLANESSPLNNLQLLLIGRSYGAPDVSSMEYFEVLLKSYFEIKANLSENADRHLHVILYTGYQLNDFGLINYWKMVNNWAIEFNETVIFQEAFDQVYSPGNEIHSGWWKLVDNRNYLNASEYEYQDKEQILAKLIELQQQATFFSTRHILIILGSVAMILLFGIVSWVCYYLKVVKSVSRQLTKHDKDEFFGGKQCSDGGNRGHINIMDHLEYDQSYEVALERIKIDRLKVLGTGHFGVVCVAEIMGMEAEVAAKMSRSTCSVLALKDLLSEIKVLSYLGHHKNITNLIGAYTAEIGNSKVYVFTELCQNGSLEMYLQQVDNKYENCSESVKWQELNVHFFQWSIEIATGMEFLASKKVVHADLATRNVLLTKNWNAKICDFGLSRRLYNLPSYEKKGNAKIPWRWTAPEALRGLTFNEKTDVWSYGVTLWEMYTIGELPYSNALNSDELLRDLDGGGKLPQPIYSFATNMYNEVMLTCWTLNTLKRPTFGCLLKTLGNLGSGIDQY